MVRRRLLFVFALACGQLPAQAPPGPAIPRALDRSSADPGEGSPAATRARLGLDALAAGDHASAAAHLLAALEFHPTSPVLLRALLTAAADAPDARALWAHRLLRAIADDRGRARPDRELTGLLPDDDPSPQKIAQARADVVAELARFASRLKPKGSAALGNGLLARWANDLAWELVRQQPALARAHGEAFGDALARFEPDYDAVLDALEKLMKRTPRATAAPADDAAAAADLALRNEQALAVRAARCLTGLAAQANFKDLEGPQPPPLGQLASAARRTLARLRAGVEARVGEPWPVEELRALTPAERADFTRTHADWSNPGIALSPGGRYRIQTICGLETLLGAAETVEYHHARLVDFFGEDPFERRQGTIYIVPEHTGLEEEGAPYWWAGGFQRGDVTTIRFAWGNIPGMGRALTHELTHRFDGAIYDSLPSWLVEGKAVWTGGSYGKMREGSFIDRFLATGTVSSAFVKGYARAAKLKQLVEGEIDDYRDNYTAGYALYAYLASWPPDGEPLYRERLERFMRNARAGRKDPFGFFESMFCDGKAGRPDGFDAFAAEFQTFLQGCYRWGWKERDASNAFVGRYVHQRAGEGGQRVLDEPSWSWARNRAEPWFGEGHARAAGRLLAEVGEDRAAAAAYLWSLRTDGWWPESAAALAELLARLGRKEAAWVARREGRLRFPAELGEQPEEQLGETPSLRGLPKLRALLAALRAASSDYAGDGLELAARALAVEHDELAARTGARPVALPPITRDDRPPLYPLRENPHAVGVFGWTEDGLTGYEERRVEGLWFETETGDLHVGRKRAREDTGLKDRRAVQRHAFARGVEWLEPGEYVVRTRVHFTTSFVSGAIVLGYARRDRNLRLGFSAGDFLYSIGRAEEDRKTKSVGLSLTGMWERGRSLPTSNQRRRMEFDRPSSFFDVELHVRGPHVEVSIMGEPWMSYTTPDRSPIEGAIGFAMGQGAVRVQQPTVQRLDRQNLEIDSEDPRLAAIEAIGLDPSVPGPSELGSIIRRATRGIPLAETGTIVVWVPEGEEAGDAEYFARRAIRRLARFTKDRVRYPQKWVLAMSRELPKDEHDEVVEIFRAVLPAGFEVIRHAGAVFDDDLWLLFVDAQGVLRVAVEARDAKAAVNIEGWARFYRIRRTG